MYDTLVSVVNTGRKILDNDTEELILTLKIELEKQAYIDRVTSFYYDRMEKVRRRIASGYKCLRPLQKSLKAIKKHREEGIEKDFFLELNDVLLKKLFFDDCIYCNSTRLGQDQDIRYLAADVCHVDQDFNGYLKLELVLPQKEQRRKLFTTQSIVKSLQSFTYYYYLAGSGAKRAVDYLLGKYAKQEPVPCDYDEHFCDGEWIILNKLQKPHKGAFALSAVARVITEEYCDNESIDISRLNSTLFDERKEGLLGKLAFDTELTHAVLSNNNVELSVDIKHRSDKFNGEIKIRRNDTFCPLYLAFDYNINGFGDFLYYGNFLRDYWPSSTNEYLEEDEE